MNSIRALDQSLCCALVDSANFGDAPGLDADAADKRRQPVTIVDAAALINKS